MAADRAKLDTPEYTPKPSRMRCNRDATTQVLREQVSRNVARAFPFILIQIRRTLDDYNS